jgi:hypothetical protein
MYKKVFILANPMARATAVQAVKTAPEGYKITVAPVTRSLDQNAMFHGICDKLGKANAVWAGKPRNEQEWKVLLVSGHAIATKQQVEIVPGLEGEFVNIRESTAKMSKERGNSLIEYTLAYCAANGVDLK